MIKFWIVYLKKILNKKIMFGITDLYSFLKLFMKIEEYLLIKN